MESKAYVLRYFPDAYIRPGYLVYEIIHDNKVIGKGDLIDNAWEGAKQWIESLSEDQKPIKHG